MLNNRYEIRLAERSDHPALVAFLDQHWKKNHVFTYSKRLLDWQHFDKQRNVYNFVLGAKRGTGEIHGILGFIRLSQFDNLGIEPTRLCWMAIWKIQEAAAGFGLGRQLLSYIEETIMPETISTVGASEMTLRMYQARNYATGRLNQYFILSPYKSTYELASAPQQGLPRIDDPSHSSKKRLIEISKSEIRRCAGIFLSQVELPVKSPDYMVNRYLRHPFYRYSVYAIRDGLTTAGLVVIRICAQGNARALRIVDFIGPSEALRGLEPDWFSLLKTTGAEYVDFFNAGIEDQHLRESGFSLRTEKDKIIVPNYFEPFVRSNIDIHYAIRAPSGKKFRIVKGDSDQDRPNLVTDAS